jgi:hypothetical protein
MILFNKTYCTIHYYKESNVVHLDWNKRSTRDQFIEACDFSLNVMQETNAKKMIADNSKVSVVAVENQNWLTEKWFPRALKIGFQYSAVIVSNDAFVKFAVKRIENNINNNLFIIQYFNDLSLAKEWLAQVE